MIDEHGKFHPDPICRENTCGHLQCVVWWNTQAIKGRGHDGTRHPDLDRYPCADCAHTEQERQRTAGLPSERA